MDEVNCVACLELLIEFINKCIVSQTVEESLCFDLDCWNCVLKNLQVEMYKDDSLVRIINQVSACCGVSLQGKFCGVTDSSCHVGVAGFSSHKF